MSIKDKHGPQTEAKRRRESRKSGSHTRPPVECGDSSRLSRRRLVAVKLRHASDLARVPPLARAVNAPFASSRSPTFAGDQSPRKSGDQSPHSKIPASTTRRAPRRLWSAVTRHRFRTGDLSPSNSGTLPASRACPPPARAVNALVAQVSKPAVSPISKSAAATDFPACAASRRVAGGRTACGFRNPRYSRLGSLRYKGAVRGCDPGARRSRRRDVRIVRTPPANPPLPSRSTLLRRKRRAPPRSPGSARALAENPSGTKSFKFFTIPVRAPTLDARAHPAPREGVCAPRESAATPRRLWSAVTRHRFRAGDLSPSNSDTHPLSRACRRWREP